MNWSIVQLEMVNILLAVKLFQAHWSGRNVLIKCNNEAVVSVLRSGKTKDAYLGACTRDIWYVCALADIDGHYVHVGGWTIGWVIYCPVGQVVARTLQLQLYIEDPVWIPVDMRLLEIDPKL